MSLSSDGTVMTMPVQPAYQGNGNGMWGGDWSSWIILFLIFGLFGLPRLEVAGAALATVIGQFIAAGLSLFFNLTRNHDIQFRFRGFRPDRGIIARIYSVGVPSIVMSSIGSVMVFGMNKILISFTTTATAVFGIYFKLQSFIFMPVFGLNNGMVPIVAYNYGAGRPDHQAQCGCCGNYHVGRSAGLPARPPYPAGPVPVGE